MDLSALQKQFARMGARVTVNQGQTAFAVDIRRDKAGSLFDIALDNIARQVIALDVQPRQRHLLLMVRPGQTHKFLCGHDERDWFAAAIPEGGSVTNVRSAMEALKPIEVRVA